MNLPDPIHAFFKADEINDFDAVIRTFAPDTVVEDENQTYAGLQAIEQWWHAAKAKYQHAAEPLEMEQQDGGIKVRARVTGQFPGSPAMLTYRFRLADENITALEIGV